MDLFLTLKESEHIGVTEAERISSINRDYDLSSSPFEKEFDLNKQNLEQARLLTLVSTAGRASIEDGADAGWHFCCSANSRHQPVRARAFRV